MANERRLIIQRSGSVYLVGDNEQAIIVDLDEGTTSPILGTQSALAHLFVSAPWEVIIDRDDLPTAVKAALDQMTASRA